MKTVIFYSSTDGHTRKIAETMASQWQGAVVVAPIDQIRMYLEDIDIATVVIGASIRYGHFQADLVETIIKHRHWLAARQSAFFSVNLSARKPGKDDPARSTSVQRFLRTTGWIPDQIAIFAGKLAYPKYRFWDKWMIRFIMLLTGGCTDGKSTVEYTNWGEVHRFSKTVSGLSSAA